MGIKLPWTLNDEENWNKTHRFAGPCWVIGGIMVMFTGLFENEIYPGVKPMLKKLHNSGMRLAVASSKPQVFVEKILEKMTFLSVEPKIGEPTTTLIVNGEKYSINTMQKMKTGEYITVDSIMKSDATNFAAILAVLCRKEGEIYDSTFEAEKFEKRVEMFEKIPMLEAMRVINFFIQRYLIFNKFNIAIFTIFNFHISPQKSKSSLKAKPAVLTYTWSVLELYILFRKTLTS